MKKYAKLIIALGLAGGIMLTDARKTSLVPPNRLQRRNQQKKQQKK